MAIAQIELKPAAAEIHRSDAQIKVVFSGRRFGKTRLMLTSGIEECLKTLEHPRQGERHPPDDPRCQRPSPPES